jgi:hypothetical protein
VLAFTGVILVAGLYLLVIRPDRAARGAAEATGTPTSRPVAPSKAARTPPGTASAESRSAADAAIAELVAGHPSGAVSVSVYNPKTGASYTYGARSGMVTASITKLDILEAMLLQHEETGTTLSSAVDAQATRMIENSDNAAADWLFAHSIGARTGLIKANERLGLRCTQLGPGYYWGLGTTCASDQVTLLRHLVDTHGPLDAASRQYAIGLLARVEPDQRWGVGAAADAGTTFVNKNGWLALEDDGGLWAVNSDGIINAHGQQVLISVLTQHNSAFQPGVTLTEAVARAATAVVAG